MTTETPPLPLPLRYRPRRGSQPRHSLETTPRRLRTRRHFPTCCRRRSQGRSECPPARPRESAPRGRGGESSPPSTNSASFASSQSSRVGPGSTGGRKAGWMPDVSRSGERVRWSAMKNASEGGSLGDEAVVHALVANRRALGLAGGFSPELRLALEAAATALELACPPRLLKAASTESPKTELRPCEGSGPSPEVEPPAPGGRQRPLLTLAR